MSEHYHWLNTGSSRIISVTKNQEVSFLNRIPLEFILEGYRPLHKINQVLSQKGYPFNPTLKIRKEITINDLLSWINKYDNFDNNNFQTNVIKTPDPKTIPDNIYHASIIQKASLIGISKTSLAHAYKELYLKPISRKNLTDLKHRTLIKLVEFNIKELSNSDDYLNQSAKKANLITEEEFDSITKHMKIISSYNNHVKYYVNVNKSNNVNFVIEQNLNTYKGGIKKTIINIRKEEKIELLKIKAIEYQDENKAILSPYYLGTKVFEDDKEFLDYYKNNSSKEDYLKEVFHDNQYVTYNNQELKINLQQKLTHFEVPLLQINLEENIYDNKSDLIKRVKELDIETDNLEDLSESDLRLLIAENIKENNLEIKENLITKDISYLDKNIKTIEDKDLFEWLTVNSFNSGLLTSDSLSLAFRLQEDNSSKLIFKPLNTFEDFQDDLEDK